MFGFSGLWEHPQSTVPGVLAGIVGVASAMGWITQETGTRLAGAAPMIIGVILMFYKGSGPKAG